MLPRRTQGFPKKMLSMRSSRLANTNIYMCEKLYYIDKTTTTVNFINFECRSDGDILVIVFYFSVNNKPDFLILKNRFGTDTL